MSWFFTRRCTLSSNLLRKPCIFVYLAMDVCLHIIYRKRARRAILKYGNACALSSADGGAQGKTWLKPPQTRWRKCEKKLRLRFLRLKWWKGCHSKSRRSFFLIGFECSNLAARRGRRTFDHFLTPVTLPAGYLWIYEHIWYCIKL